MRRGRAAATGPGKADCPICHGRKWRTVVTPDAEYVTECDCYLAGRRERALAEAGIPAGLAHCDLASFDTVSPRQEFAKRIVRDFLDTYPMTGATGLLFHGPSGTGKTHLAVAIVAELVRDGRASARFLDFRSLLKMIQESWNPVYETSERELLEGVLSVDLLAMDDLGAEKSSSWVRETVGYLINERYVRGKPMVITTNLTYRPPHVPVAEAADVIARRTQGSRGAGAVDTLEDRIGTASMSRLYEICKPIDMSRIDDFRATVKLFSTDKFRPG